MPASARSAIRLGFVALAALLSSCRDEPTGIGDPDLEVTLSNPVVMFATAAAPLAPGTTEPQRVVYVSLSPHIVPTGVSAVISVRGTSFALTEIMTDGALDPVPVPADVGDTIDLLITNHVQATTRFVTEVPSRKRPKVVRTVPPRGKTDVPLNGAVRVVFSEPIDPRTLIPGAIELRHEGTIVGGQLEFQDGERLTAVFAPDAQLLPNASYRLVISGTIRDLDGDPLDRAITVSFTAGTQVEQTGPVASVTVSPNPALVAPFQSIRFTAIVRDALGHVLSGRVVTWESSDAAVARVHVPGGDTIPINGVIDAIGVGAATITATSEGVFGSAAMTVRSESGEGTGTVKSIVIVPGSLAIPSGENTRLTVTLRDADGRVISTVDRPDIHVAWRSSNTAVVALGLCCGSVVDGVTTEWDDNPLLYSKSQGSAVITASTEGVSGTAVVTVGPPRTVALLKMSPASKTLLPQQKGDLIVTVWDANGVQIWGRPITWTSSDPTVATVEPLFNFGNTELAEVTAVSAGTALVTATTEGVTASATITALSPPTFTSVAAGDPDGDAMWTTWDGHTCGITSSGHTLCWGGNDYGQLGDDTYYSSVVPVVVSGGHTFSSVSVGAAHSCALTAGGAAYCWGHVASSNWFGPFVPMPISGGLSFVSLDAGVYSTCALTAAGAAYCWGSSPTSPQAVPGGITFSSLSVGRDQACGLSTAGSVYCWDNPFGTPVPIAGGHVFTAVTAGHRHNCGLAANGAAYCWGANPAGELGDGTTTNRLVPTLVSGGNNFVAISAGSGQVWQAGGNVGASTTCGLTAAGAAYCWGGNEVGQLGDGTTIDRLVPTAVAGGLQFASISSGGAHTCAVTTTSIAYCWGLNGVGRLGNANGEAFSKVPLKVFGQP